MLIKTPHRVIRRAQLNTVPIKHVGKREIIACGLRIMPTITGQRNISCDFPLYLTLGLLQNLLRVYFFICVLIINLRK